MPRIHSWDMDTVYGMVCGMWYDNKYVAMVQYGIVQEWTFQILNMILIMQMRCNH